MTAPADSEPGGASARKRSGDGGDRCAIVYTGGAAHGAAQRGLLVAAVPQHGGAVRGRARHVEMFGMRRCQVLLRGVPEGALEGSQGGVQGPAMKLNVAVVRHLVRGYYLDDVRNSCAVSRSRQALRYSRPRFLRGVELGSG